MVLNQNITSIKINEVSELFLRREFSATLKLENLFLFGPSLISITTSNIQRFRLNDLK